MSRNVAESRWISLGTLNSEVIDLKEVREPFERNEDVASLTECTGLMPALPKDEAQDVSYASLYGIHKAAKPRPKYRRK